MSVDPKDDATRQEIIGALQKLLAERQTHVLRLEALAKEEGGIRRRLAELADEQHILIERLKGLVGPPEAG